MITQDEEISVAVTILYFLHVYIRNRKCTEQSLATNSVMEMVTQSIYEKIAMDIDLVC